MVNRVTNGRSHVVTAKTGCQSLAKILTKRLAQRVHDAAVAEHDGHAFIQRYENQQARCSRGVVNSTIEEQFPRPEIDFLRHVSARREQTTETMKPFGNCRAGDEGQQCDNGQQHNLSPHRNPTPSAGIRMSGQREEDNDRTNDRAPQPCQIFCAVVSAGYRGDHRHDLTTGF